MAVLLAACTTSPASVSSESPSSTERATSTATLATATTASSATATPNAAIGGIEVFATGALHGSYAWIVRETTLTDPTRVSDALYAVSADGGAAKMVLRFSRSRCCLPLVLGRQLSPDGERLALEQPSLGPAAHDGFIVIDLRTGTISELARFDAMADVMPAWSPDGTKIAFARAIPNAPPVSADNGLWMINADGTGLKRLLPAATQAQRTNVLGWTADGTGIAYGLSFEGLTYSVASAADGHVLGPTTAFAVGPAPASWRRESPQFVGAFSDGDKGGDQRIVVADGPGRPLRTVVSEKQLEPGEPYFLNARWNPQAAEFLYIRSARQSQIVRVSSDGAKRTTVSTSMSPSQAEWLADGRIVYIGNANGVGSVLRVTDGARDVSILDFLAEGGATFGSLAVRSYP